MLLQATVAAAVAPEDRATYRWSARGTPRRARRADGLAQPANAAAMAELAAPVRCMQQARAEETNEKSPDDQAPQPQPRDPAIAAATGSDRWRTDHRTVEAAGEL